MKEKELKKLANLREQHKLDVVKMIIPYCPFRGQLTLKNVFGDTETNYFRIDQTLGSVFIQRAETEEAYNNEDYQSIYCDSGTPYEYLAEIAEALIEIKA